MTTEQSAYDIATRFQNHEDWHHSPDGSEPELGILEDDPGMDQYIGYTEFEHSDTGAILMLTGDQVFRDNDELVATAELCQPLDSELDIQYDDDFEDSFFSELFDAYRELEERHGTAHTGSRDPDSSVVLAASFPQGYDLDAVDQTAKAFSEISSEVQAFHYDLRSVVWSLSGGADSGSR